MIPILAKILLLFSFALFADSKKPTLKELDAIKKEATEKLKDIEDIEYKIAQDKLIIDGQVLLPRDFNRIYQFKNRYKDEVASLVTFKPKALEIIAEIIQRDIRSDLNIPIVVKLVNQKYHLLGTVLLKEQKEKAELIANTYLPSGGDWLVSKIQIRK